MPTLDELVAAQTPRQRYVMCCVIVTWIDLRGLQQIERAITAGVGWRVIG